MRTWMLGAVVGLGCTTALVACSEEETKKASPSQDAGSDASAEGGGGVAGLGGAAGSSGSAGTAGGSGGVAGLGGAAGSSGSAGAAGGSGGSGGSGGALVCEPRFDPGAAGAAGTTDGGPNGYKWRDWANQVCADCVGTTLECADFDELTSYHEPATRRLTIVLEPGRAELVEATLRELIWRDVGTSGSLNEELPMQINGNVLTVELPSTVPTSAYRLATIALVVTDACGVTSTIDSAPLAGDDGGDPTATQWPIYCEW